MPLKQGSSRRVFTTNLKRELKAGKPKKQALAIAYDVQRRNKSVEPEAQEIVTEQRRGFPGSRHGG